jgi:hypothetical protein
MSRLAFARVVAGLCAIALALAAEREAFAQAGATGGTLGKTDKSESGEREEAPKASAPEHKATKPAARAEEPVKAAGGPKTFSDPRINGAHVNWCMTTQLGGCGQEAANTWCESKGFKHATSFHWVVQSPAISQGDRVRCDGFCGAFTQVTCE